MHNITSPSLFRRLAAMLYDTVLLVALIIILAMPLPLIPESARNSDLGSSLTFIGMLVIVAIFFAWFWTHGGQTLGMRAWRIRITRNDGEPVSWGDALKRLGYAALSLAPAGLGFLWALVDRERMTWHDRLSGTVAHTYAKGEA